MAKQLAQGHSVSKRGNVSLGVFDTKLIFLIANLCCQAQPIPGTDLRLSASKSPKAFPCQPNSPKRMNKRLISNQVGKTGDWKT